MGFFNNNYSELKRQIDFIEKGFSNCKTKADFYSYFATYQTLCALYKVTTGIDIYDLSGPLKLSASIIEGEFSKKVINGFYDSFYEDRNISLPLFEKCYFKAIDSYVGFLEEEGSYLDSLPFKELSCDLEAMEIIYSFLDSEFPSSKVLFDDLFANGRVFDLGSGSKYIDREAVTFFNPVERISNLFLRGKFRTISDLSSFVHEFGHAFDSDFLSKVSTDLCVPVVNGVRVDVEALSCFYQFRFLDYLIKNDIYKYDARKELATDLGALLYHLENGYFISMANKEEYDKLKLGQVSKGEYILGLLDRGLDITLPDFLDISDLDYVLSIPETASYSYGLILGSSFTDVNSYIKFAATYNESLEKRLGNSNITPEVASIQLVKKIETLYN